jgi:4-hydroxy-3-methylbut-2-enyl diphosphate reductase IspH
MIPEGAPLSVKRILLAAPRGFCAGVVRAIEIVDLALDCFEGPVYVRREIVHNSHVVRDFEARGVRSSPRTASRRRCGPPPRPGACA